MRTALHTFNAIRDLCRRRRDPLPRALDRRPTFEGLEGRQLLSATLVGDVLTIDGTAGNDAISISAGAVNGEVIVDSAPDVEGGTVFAGVNTVIINGLNGNDKIIIGEGIVDALGAVIGMQIDAGDGNDHVQSADGDDTIELGAGNDRLNDSGGDNTVTAASGHNKIQTGGGIDTITTGNGHDKIKSGAGDDVIDAGNGNNKVDGQAGNDTITTGNGKDKVKDRDGSNTIDVGEGKNKVTTGDGDDQVTGGDEHNHVKDSGGNNTITTGAGKDKITTGDGDDVINSGNGKDKIKNGAGTDTVDNDRYEDAEPVAFTDDAAQVADNFKNNKHPNVYTFTAEADGTVDFTLTPDAGQTLTVVVEDDGDTHLLTITGGTLTDSLAVTTGSTYYFEVIADAKGQFVIDMTFTAA